MHARITLSLAALALLGATPAFAAEDSFVKLADQYWDEEAARDPGRATELGIHTYDDKLTDFSAAAVAKYVARQKEWLTRFGAVDGTKLGPVDAIDLELCKQSARRRLVELEEHRRWRRLPRLYADESLYPIYLVIKRSYAPAEVRLKSVIAREEAIPTLLASARNNLDDMAKINVELALEELPSNIEFLKNDAVQAFTTVKDPALRKRFTASTETATRALGEFAAWLKKEKLPKAKESFAIGADVFSKKLAADEGIDLPLDAVLARGEAELQRLRDAFVATARKIDPKRPAKEVQASLAADHGKPETLIADIQSRLAGLRKFLVDKQIVSIPSTVMPIVQESPPFMRAFTLASMDTPGPFETKATEAYYNVTLPNPKWTPAEVENYMRGALSSTILDMVSIHEAFPGHYTQFLWAPKFPSRTRKNFYCSSNSEGWAHYAEQMMLDEGVGEPKLRLAQLQEALLRATRYVVGIRMHTRGMTLPQAIDFFENQGMQSRKVAEMESKRGTEDPTYLYYTYGKLDILKLRDDYKAKLGAQYSLRKFHDAFLAEGAIPLPLMRKVLLR
ncbi:MAG: hypothetical protein JWN44_2531 [Myxococcales bacterium]|nr:hypothetical protein [Myxococcales bacterium]